MLQLPDRVLYTWDRPANERPAPDFGRITREFLTAWEGDRTRWDQPIAVDVQRFPRIAVGIFDVYREALPRAQTEGFRELAGGDPVGGFAAGGGPPTV